MINGGTSRWTLADAYAHAFQELGHEAIPLNLFYDLERETPRPEHKVSRFHPFAKTVSRKVAQIFWGALEETRRRMMPKIRELNPNLILVIGNIALAPDFLINIKKSFDSCPIFWYLTDPLPTQSPSFIKSVPFYDCIFTFSRFQVAVISWFGGRQVVYLPFGYDPRIHKPTETTESERHFYGSDIAYLGTWQPYIELWANELTPYHLKVWGDQWYKSKGYPALLECWQGEGRGLYDEFAKVVNSSKIIFNVVRFHNGNSHSMKTFEIPACGGFMLTNRTDEQLSFFSEDQCAVYFSSKEELQDKLHYYLSHDEARTRIARAAYQATKQHSYRERAKIILDCAQWKRTTCR